jgi:hypothetical protein
MNEEQPTTKKDENCEAIHGQTEDGSMHVVGIGNLRVLITNDDGSWFAQGLEIDYGTEGDTIDEVKKNFAAGLYGTIQQHLKIYGSIKNLLQPAPPDDWQEFFSKNQFVRQRYTHVGIHKLTSIESIEYLQEAA